MNVSTTNAGAKTMTDTLHADLLVIGFGKGGKTVAAQMGHLGQRVVLVEASERMYGGTCPNVGCVPTKGLVHHSGKKRPTDPPQEFYAEAVRAVQDVRELMRKGNIDAMSNAPTVTVLTGRAAFIDSHTVSVAVGDDRVVVSADTILVNAGSEPIIPAGITGLRASRYLVTSTDLIETTTLPPRLAIIGGAYLGIEFASIYCRFGSQVTMIESSPQILAREDDDVREAVERILAEDGIEIVSDGHVTAVRDGESAATVAYIKDGHEHTVEADAVLVATGRAPATHGLNLEAAGVRTDQRGAIEVDEFLHTSQPHIYALGDVNGGPQFTYISLDDSRVVLDQLTGKAKRSTKDRVAIPHTVFMTPPLATVGLTEKQAHEAGYRIKVTSEPVADITAMPRAYAVEQVRGLMKFVTDLETDQILGAVLLSVDAQELVNTVALAMRHGLTAAQLRDSIYTHPSSTEAFNEVFDSVVRSD
jgi:pyruvate/2-oxoglutarate dehydrogenase complex dihydrolipoamide dehydrogenase (E3) component